MSLPVPRYHLLPTSNSCCRYASSAAFLIRMAASLLHPLYTTLGVPLPSCPKEHGNVGFRDPAHTSHVCFSTCHNSILSIAAHHSSLTQSSLFVSSENSSSLNAVAVFAHEPKWIEPKLLRGADDDDDLLTAYHDQLQGVKGSFSRTSSVPHFRGPPRMIYIYARTHACRVRSILLWNILRAF